MDEVAERITAETEGVVRTVSELTILPTRWNGSARLVDEGGFLARKRWQCDIEIDRSIVNKDERWPTLVHEAIHSVSAGLTREAYNKMRGWEEGPAENLQRIILSEVMQRLGITVDQGVVAERIASHVFNPFNEAIEEIRIALSEGGHVVEPVQFYISLIGIPLIDRPGYVLALGSKRTGLPRIPFIRVFSSNNAILTGR
jgi:hypothetical protein